MKNLSTGTGLALLSAAILGSTIIMRFGPADQAAHAAPPMEAAKAIAAASTAQVTPTIVWMGVTRAINGGYGGQSLPEFVYHRLWSDGRQEVRTVLGTYPEAGAPSHPCGYYPEFVPSGCSFNWREIAPPPSGTGFACRADVDGNRIVDGADLGVILSNWGPQPPCEPEVSFPCFTMASGNLAK
jgi:hypothetical protein